VRPGAGAAAAAAAAAAPIFGACGSREPAVATCTWPSPASSLLRPTSAIELSLDSFWAKER